MRVICLIQARTGSTRLPNKINADIGGKPMLWHVMQRADKIKVDDLKVARPEDYPTVSENDVLGRYWQAAAGYDGIMRITGDCPLIDPVVAQEVLGIFRQGIFDYVANDIIRTFPDGLGCEVMTFAALKYAHQKAERAYDREHVTTFLKNDKTFMRYQAHNVWRPIDEYTELKLSVDTQDDLDFVRAIDAEKPSDYTLAATLGAYQRVKAKNDAQRTDN